MNKRQKKNIYGVAILTSSYEYGSSFEAYSSGFPNPHDKQGAELAGTKKKGGGTKLCFIAEATVRSEWGY